MLICVSRVSSFLTRAAPVLGATFAAPGGGASRSPPPLLTRLLRIVEENGKKAFESSSKTITKLLQSFFGSGQN